MKNSKWILCHNGKDIFHCIFFTEGWQISTGQPYIEEFVTKEELLNRVREINPDYESEIEE
jgi:hypothetical protein